MVSNIYSSYFKGVDNVTIDNTGVTEQNSSCFSRWLWKYYYLRVMTNVIFIYLEIKPVTQAVSEIAYCLVGICFETVTVTFTFSRRFYPKRLALHSGYNIFFFFFCLYACSLGIEPMGEKMRKTVFGLRPSVSFCSPSAKNFHFGASLVNTFTFLCVCSYDMTLVLLKWNDKMLVKWLSEIPSVFSASWKS